MTHVRIGITFGAILSLVTLLGPVIAQADPVPGERSVFDASNGFLPGVLVRGEGDPATGDLDVDSAYDALGTWRTFMLELYGRSSYDGNGGPLGASVHGPAMSEELGIGTIVLDDGDGVSFGSEARAPDLIYGLITDGMIDHTAGLVAEGGPGVLRVSIRDAFSAVGDAYALIYQGKHPVPWVIGESLVLQPGGFVRSLANPTFDGYGIDHYSNYPLQSHLTKFQIGNAAGIVNNGFYLLSAGGTNSTSGIHVTTGINIFAAGQLWYDALTHSVGPTTTLKGWATAVQQAAVARHGAASPEAATVTAAFVAVGLVPTTSGLPQGVEPLLLSTSLTIDGRPGVANTWGVRVPAGAVLRLSLEAGRASTGSPRLSIDRGDVVVSSDPRRQIVDVPASRVDRDVYLGVSSNVVYRQWTLSAAIPPR